MVGSVVPEAVMDYYNAMLAERGNRNVRQQMASNGRIKTISGTGEATVTDIALLNDKGERVELLDVGMPVTLLVKVQVNASIPRLVLGYVIKDRLGQPLFGTNTHHLQRALHDLNKGVELIYRFSFNANFGEGSYSIATALVSDNTHLTNNYEWRDIALIFNVVNVSKFIFVGSNWMPIQLEMIR